MGIEYPLRRRLSDFISMLLVSILSLFLLLYIGLGEAQRTYEQLHSEKMMAQAQIVQNAMEKVLRPGFPLKQYVILISAYGLEYVLDEVGPALI